MRNGYIDVNIEILYIEVNRNYFNKVLGGVCNPQTSIHRTSMVDKALHIIPRRDRCPAAGK